MNEGTHQAISKDRRRLLFIAIGVFSLFSFLLVQFFHLQIIEGSKWEELGKNQHQLSITLPFKRGIFYASPFVKIGQYQSPKPLVVDVPKYHLYIDPLNIPSAFRSEIVQFLIRYFQLEENNQHFLQEQFQKRSRSRRIRLWLSYQEKNEINMWWRPFAKQHKIPINALYFVQEYHRSYPYGNLLGSVLHTVREDRDLVTKQNLPTGGLELYFDRYLQGKEGKKILLRSPTHHIESGKIVKEPEHGADVYLTIHPYLQAIAEEEITNAVIHAKAKSGWVVMMDPYNGEIYALAQSPSLDPGDYRTFFNDPKLIEHTKVKAITDCFEPGSCMKPISALIALMANQELLKRGEEPLFDPQGKLRSDDGTFPGRKRYPIKDLRRHKFLNLDLAIQKSSNVYVAKLIYLVIERLGEQWYREKLYDVFGFGKKTGIELPSESAGFLPRIGAKYPNGKLEWSLPTPYSLAMGYNILCNSLQLLRAFALIANGGKEIQPTLLKKIVKTDYRGEETLLKTEAPCKARQLIDPELTHRIIHAMKGVTKPGGTGTRGDISGFTEAGKTSTSEKIVHGTYSKKNHFASFFGFAPAKAPMFVVMVGIDEPEYRVIPGVGKIHHGGRVAAPVFKRVLERTFEYLGVEPDDPYGYPPGDPRFDAKKADHYSEVKRLNQLYKSWNH